jgi:hypothetical protein
MKTILVVNIVNYHYEIIESVLVNMRNILPLKKETVKVYLYCYNDRSFKKYISNKYPEIIIGFTSKYDFMINCTIYNKDTKWMKSTFGNKKYIAHEVTDDLVKNPNVIFLSPFGGWGRYLKCTELPFKNNKVKNKIPIYIIQGNLYDNRRNMNLLIKILEGNYDKEFIIRIIGKGEYPISLSKYKDMIEFKRNLDFINFHKQFLDCYCILPLISKDTQPEYYTNKLTSTINYSMAYSLKILIDKNLQEIYKLKNVEIFNDENDIVRKFNNTLEDFYS